MKVGIVGVGHVGTSCAKALLLRGSCSELVLIDVKEQERHTRGVRNDLSHGEPLCPGTTISVGQYEDLGDASVVVVTAGENEKTGGAIDRSDPWGRQRLLVNNGRIYRQLVPEIVQATSDAPIVVVTDPPDTLADVAREVVLEKSTRNPVISTGTFLDALRFRIQIAERLRVSPRDVDAHVIGEHGKTQVYQWSSVRVNGEPVKKLIRPDEYPSESEFRDTVERGVIDANIDIIEATDASQHGIGIVTARIVEAILGGEQTNGPVGVWQPGFGATLSLPGILGRGGAVSVHDLPAPSSDEQRGEEAALQRSAAYLAEAYQRGAEGGIGFDSEPSLTWAARSKQLDVV